MLINNAVCRLALFCIFLFSFPLSCFYSTVLLLHLLFENILSSFISFPLFSSPPPSLHCWRVLLTPVSSPGQGITVTLRLHLAGPYSKAFNDKCKYFSSIAVKGSYLNIFNSIFFDLFWLDCHNCVLINPAKDRGLRRRRFLGFWAQKHANIETDKNANTFAGHTC